VKTGICLVSISFTKTKIENLFTYLLFGRIPHVFCKLFYIFYIGGCCIVWGKSFCVLSSSLSSSSIGTVLLDLSVQFSSVTQLCPTLCDPKNHSTPGLPVHYQLPEFTEIHVHRVSDAIQPSHPLSSPSPPAPNPSHHQSLFQ